MEILVEVGGEGGSVRLLGRRAGGSWSFRVASRDCLAEAEDGPPAATDRPWTDSWDGALGEFDAYPWPHLYPLAVHPEFRRAVEEALRARVSLRDDQVFERWRPLLASEGPSGV